MKARFDRLFKYDCLFGVTVAIASTAAMFLLTGLVFKVLANFFEAGLMSAVASVGLTTLLIAATIWLWDMWASRNSQR